MNFIKKNLWTILHVGFILSMSSSSYGKKIIVLFSVSIKLWKYPFRFEFSSQIFYRAWPHMHMYGPVFPWIILSPKCNVIVHCLTWPWMSMPYYTWLGLFDNEIELFKIQNNLENLLCLLNSDIVIFYVKRQKCPFIWSVSFIAQICYLFLFWSNFFFRTP